MVPTQDLPSLYVLNAAALSKPHALEQLYCELTSNSIDIAIISETHFKSKHADNVVNLEGYNLHRRDRLGRRGGGVALYVRSNIQSTIWTFSADDKRFELLWVRLCNGIFVAAVYHPPLPVYKTTDFLEYLEHCVHEINANFALPYIIIAGDLNALPDQDIEETTSLIQIVCQPTRGVNVLDRVFVTDMQYVTVRVLSSTVRSDHKAIVAYAQTRPNCSKTVVRRTFRRKSPSQNAHFLRILAETEFNCYAADMDTQAAFDNFYSVAVRLMDTCYPVCSITTTSRDPSYITPELKQKLRRKNRLMKAGRIEEAECLANQISKQIVRRNKTSLLRVNGRTNANALWKAVQQVTGRKQAVINVSGLTADSLNKHYAAMSTDSGHQLPRLKQSASGNHESLHYTTEWQIFRILDQLHPTATGLDQLPAWFLRLGAAAFSRPISWLFNRSLANSVVPQQWKAAWIQPIPKVPVPTKCSDFRPISITPVLTRVMEKTVVKHFLYPAILTPPAGLLFADQFAFRPTGSTTAAIISLFQKITDLLVHEPFVIVLALDFSKAFDKVRHVTLMEKMAQLDIPDHVYNWFIHFFNGHSHCVKFQGDTSTLREINASVIQGSALGPASYVVNAADLQPITPGNDILKYADDTYLIIPAKNADSRTEELTHVENWSKANNLQLNRDKSIEIVIADNRRMRHYNEPSAVLGIQRVTELKILGVTVTNHMSISYHITNILQSCAKSMYAMRVLRSHGLSNKDLQTVFRSVVVSKLLYASCAWIGFASAADRHRIDRFLDRCTRAGYSRQETFSELCELADSRLFSKVIDDPDHLLHCFLPPQSTAQQIYHLRQRRHSCAMPTKYTKFNCSNFLNRLLFLDSY